VRLSAEQMVVKQETGQSEDFSLVNWRTAVPVVATHQAHQPLLAILVENRSDHCARVAAPGSPSRS